MPLAVMPLLALSSLLTSTPHPLSLLRHPTLTRSPDQREPSLDPHNIIEGKVRQAREELLTTSTPSHSTTIAPRAAPLDESPRDTQLEASAHPPANRRSHVAHTADSSFGEEEEEMGENDGSSLEDREIDEPRSRRPSGTQDAEWDEPLGSHSRLDPPATPLSIASFLRRFSGSRAPASLLVATSTPAAAAAPRLQPRTPVVSVRSAHHDPRPDNQTTSVAPLNSLISAVFGGNSGASGALSALLANALAPATIPSRRVARLPDATPAPARFPGLWNRLMHVTQAFTRLPPNRTATAAADASAVSSSSLMADRDAEVVKSYLMAHLLPRLERVYSDSRDSDLQVPPVDPFAFEAFGLDADDLANNFLYKFARSILREGLGGAGHVPTAYEELLALTQRLLRPSNLLSVVRETLRHPRDSRFSGNASEVLADSANALPVIHEAFESDFDAMQKEKWFQTPEFVLSVSVLVVLILLVLVISLVSWNQRRKSSSFPVSGYEMRFESSKSEILYI